MDIIFDADHSYRSDLDVTLISPDGTESELVNYFANRDSGNNYNEWQFNSVQHWGEVSAGTWTLVAIILVALKSDTGFVILPNSILDKVHSASSAPNANTFAILPV